MSTEKIISEEGETNNEVVSQEEEIQPQNEVDFHDIIPPSKNNKICNCFHCFLAFMINLVLMVAMISEIAARIENKAFISIVDVIVDISILIIFVLIINYICTQKENILKAFTFYQIFTLFWGLVDLLSTFFYSIKNYNYNAIFDKLKFGKFILILLSFIINFTFFGCKKCKNKKVIKLLISIKIK